MFLHHKSRKLLLCAALALGSLLGAPMRPEQIEELLDTMNRPQIVETLPLGSEPRDHWLRRQLRRWRLILPPE